ncbi:MAG: MarC family protein [Thermoproteota archaeon]|jgi:multiple antibiotic resistance protein|nr:MarC family protein [Thermoproteota archaeon]
MPVSLRSRFFYGASKSKIILVTLLLCSIIGSVTSAIYYFNAVSLSDKNAAPDSPFASVSLQIQEFVNFIYNNFSSIFATSDTFGEDLVKAVISLFVVVNPIGKVPLFVTLTKRMEKQNKRLVSKNAIVTTAVLLTIFAVAGIQLLSIFGITIYSFMVAGGILLFIISIEFLTHGEWRYSGSSVSTDSGIVPLAFPLLAGPGAITTVMISLQTYGWIVSIISIVFVVLVTYLVLHVENPLLKILGSRGSTVATRIFAIFLAAIAIQYIIEGLKQLL